MARHHTVVLERAGHLLVGPASTASAAPLLPAVVILTERC
jgi:hypothetical protein